MSQGISRSAELVDTATPAFQPPSSADSRSLGRAIRSAVERYAWSRFRWDTARAVLSIGLVLCVGWMFSILLDGFLRLDPVVRILLAVALWSTAILVAWRRGLANIASRSSPVERAREMERLHPHFQERLSASIELDSPAIANKGFSAGFILQTQNAANRELRQIDWKGLIPWGQLRQPALALLLLCFCGGILTLFPNLQFSQRWLRVAIPFLDVNIPRSWRIEFVSPVENRFEAPSQQLLDIAVRAISLKNQATNPENAFVEFRATEQNGAPNLTLPAVALKRDPSQRDIFVAKVPIGDRPIQYRAVIDDAQTVWRSLVPLTRPHPVRFQGTVLPPAYSGLERIAIDQELGDLQVMAGSQVSLRIGVDQPLERATVTIENLETGEIVEKTLNQASTDREWTFDWKADRNAKYQLHLFSKTLFAGESLRNTLSTRYRIDTVVDPACEIQWLTTDQTLWREPPLPDQTWITTLDRPIPLALQVTDNLIVQSLVLEYSLNDAEWKPCVYTAVSPSPTIQWEAAKGTQQRAILEWDWDPLTCQAKSGDVFKLRLAAIDRADQSSYSSVLRFALTSDLHDPKRYDVLKSRMRLVKPGLALKSAIEESAKQIQEQRTKLTKADTSSAERLQILNEWNEWGGKIRDQLRGILLIIEEELPTLERGIDQRDFEWMGQSIQSLLSDDLLRVEYALLQEQDHQASGINTTPSEKHRRAIGHASFSTLMVQETSMHVARSAQSNAAFELLATLTADMRELAALQQRNGDGSVHWTLTQWQRSQLIAEQLWKDAKNRVDRHLGELPRSTADGLANWQRWMEDSRQRNRDTLEPLQGEADLRRVRDRIQSDADELKSQSWMHRYDDMSYQIQAFRQELILGKRPPVYTSLETMLQKLIAHENLAKNVNTSTTELAESIRLLESEWRIVGESTAGRLMLQRSLHQLRKSQDTAFIADMGLGSRAWKAVLSQWFEIPNEREGTRNTLEEVARAIRILEAAHEFHDAQQALQTLANSERYRGAEADTLTYASATLAAIAKSLEHAHRRLRETKRFDNKSMDLLQAMLWSRDYTSASQKLSERMNSPFAPIASVAPHLDSLVAYLKNCDREMESVFEEARETLRRYAPTVSQLADKAADSARNLKKATEDQNKETSESSPAERQEKVETERENLNEDAEDLRQALAELASQQDLLNPEQMARAQDGDQAAELVERVMEKLNNSLDAANASGDETAIEQAIADQASAAKAMETIARHFAPQDPNASEAPADAPSWNESLEQAISSELDRESMESQELRDEAYEKASRLQKLAQADPNALLRELEKELPNNPAMQRELSEISKAAANNALQELKRAATKEKELGLQLENQDLQLAAQKARRIGELQAITDEADRLAKTLLEKGEQLTYRIPSAGKAYEEVRKEIRRETEALRAAVQSARQLNSQSASDDLESKTRELQKAFEQGANAVANLKEQAKELVSQAVERDEQKRLNRVSEAGNAQNSIRNDVRAEANRLAKQWKDQLNRVDNEAKRLEKEIDRQQNELEKTIAEATKNPENAALREQQKRSEEALESLRESLGRNQDTSRWTQQIVSGFEERARSLDQRTKNSLNTPNPYGALIEEQLEQAAQFLQQLDEKASKLTGEDRALPEPRTPSSSLEQAAQEQSRTRENVDQIAKDLERGARHEERLGNAKGSQSLREQASAVESLDDQALKPAESSLQSATQQAAQQEQSDTSRRPKNSAAIARPKATDSKNALSKAEQALRDRADALQNAMNRAPNSSQESDSSEQKGAPSGSGQTEPTGTPPSNSSPTSGQRSDPTSAVESDPASPSVPSSDGQQSSSASAEAQQRGGEMARLLDQLDRAQNGPMLPSETGDSNESAVQDVSRLDANSDSSQVRNHKASMASALQSAASSMAQSLASELSQQRQMQALRNPIGQTYLRNQSASKVPQLGNNPRIPDRSEDYFLPSTVKRMDRDWGRLRQQKAEQVLEGTRETFDPEFDAAIRAYYQAIATPKSSPPQ
ncbi:hypothetical protein SH501x_003735 [Pirellulaceae bacterium SH501]